MGALSREWAISMAFSLVLLLVFGLGLVWLNIERVDLAYAITQMQKNIDEAEALTAKLEVERNTLVTPSRLREQAKDHGLGPARPGQIRRVAANGEIEASPMVAVTAEPAKPVAKGAAKPAAAEASKAAAKPAAAEAPKAAPAPKPFKPAAEGQQ